MKRNDPMFKKTYEHVYRMAILHFQVQFVWNPNHDEIIVLQLCQGIGGEETFRRHSYSAESMKSKIAGIVTLAFED